MRSIPFSILVGTALWAAAAGCATSKAGGGSNAGDDPPSTKISAAELAPITDRGRRLAAYDAAAWHATDAVQSRSTEPGSVAGYVARETTQGWEVAFGVPSAQRDTFRISYLAKQAGPADHFLVYANATPTPDTDYYARAFRATRTGIEAFGTAPRPYNVAVLPADSSQWWVYLVPAPQQRDVWPLGADVRFRIDSTGTRILERRQLHKTIIDYDMRGEHPAVGYHSHVLSDLPEDTDVMMVLRRAARIPEYVVTKKFTFVIAPDGGITAYDKQVK